MTKLNIGCGDVYFEGWINIDLSSPVADMLHDVRKRLPFQDNSIDFIYNEHLIEHLALDERDFFLSEIFRALKTGGILRIATPDLDYLIRKYSNDWKSQEWIKLHGYDWLETNAEMINLSFREWGHKFLYNKEELVRRLKIAGFTELKEEAWGSSDHDCLRNRETRADSRLIIEAVKLAAGFEPDRSVYHSRLEKILADRTAQDGLIAGLRDKKIEGLEAAILDKDRHIEGLEAAILDKDRHIEGLEAAVVNMDIRIKNLEQWIRDMERTIASRILRIKCDLLDRHGKN